MKGYQSYQCIARNDLSIDTVDYGSTTLEIPDEAAASSLESPAASTPASIATPASTFIRSKLGYIFVGFLAGYCNSRGLFSGERNVSKFSGAADVAEPSNRRRQPRSSGGNQFVVYGKSFFDSLPFEDILPRHPSVVLSTFSWNLVRSPPNDDNDKNHLVGSSPIHDTDNPDAPPSSSLSATLTAFLTSSSSSSSSSGTSSSGSSSSRPAPHLLYHAHPSAFSLLYYPPSSSSSSSSSTSFLSEYSADYFLLNSGGFDAQINQAYCAVASIAAVLNSLKYGRRYRDGDDITNWSFDLPVDDRYAPYAYATQADILTGDCVNQRVIRHGTEHDHDHDDDDDVSHTRPYDGIFRPPYGLNLAQASLLLQCHTSPSEWKITSQNVDPARLTLSQMRFDLQSALVDPDSRVLVNYDRKALGQVGGGHFSPLGAYHAPTDSFLIMDVAKYKYPPVWVGVETLWEAMGTVDGCGVWDFPEGQDRLDGYLRSSGNENGSASGSGSGSGSRNETNHGSAVFDPVTKEDYAKAMEVLGCQEKMRGYIILSRKLT
ncbi:hypothetical protein ACHAXS_005248 [Conticribra weissflogii]